jgi:hypothetical protein
MEKALAQTRNFYVLPYAILTNYIGETKHKQANAIHINTGL